MEKEQWLFVYTCGIGVKPGALLSVRQALDNEATISSLLFAFYFETGSGLPRVALKSSSCCLPAWLRWLSFLKTSPGQRGEAMVVVTYKERGQD